MEAINADYPRHRRAAAAIGRDYFGHDVVLGKLLQEVGLANGVRAAGTRTRVPAGGGGAEIRSE